MPHNQEQLDPQVPSHYYEFMNVQRSVNIASSDSPLFAVNYLTYIYIQDQVVDLRREIGLERDHQ